MQNWQEKLKTILQISDNDISLIVSGNFRTFMKDNRVGGIRVLSVAGIFFLMLLLYLAIFSWVSGLLRVILTTLVFGSIVGIAFKLLGKEKLLKVLSIKPIVTFCIVMFAFWSLSLFSDVMEAGSGWSSFLAFIILACIGTGVYFAFPKLVEKGVTTPQVILASLTLTAMFFSYQMAFIQISDENLKYAAEASLARIRQKDAEFMRANSMSSAQKPCTSEEDCRRMNAKPNDYYKKFESDVLEACETAVAREITTRFEWTVDAKISKFADHIVDALKDSITVTGAKAIAINDDGTRAPIIYSCTYNTKTRVTSVFVRQ